MILFQEGNLGLLSAIEDNDPSRGHPLRALVGLRVRHAMLFALKEKNGTVRVCWRSRRLLAQALRVSQEVAEQLGRQPSYAEVAAHLGWTLERVVEVMAWYHYNQVESLQGMLNEDEDEDRRNVVSVFGSVAEAGESSGGEMEHRVRQAIDTCLTDRQRRVVFARYGFGDGVAAEGSYVEIGKQFGVHGTAVHSLDVAAKKRLREALAAVVGADSVA